MVFLRSDMVFLRYDMVFLRSDMAFSKILYGVFKIRYGVLSSGGVWRNVASSVKSVRSFIATRINQVLVLLITTAN